MPCLPCQKKRQQGTRVQTQPVTRAYVVTDSDGSDSEFTHYREAKRHQRTSGGKITVKRQGR